MGGEADLLVDIRELNDAEYEVHLVLAEVPIPTAAQRAYRRFLRDLALRRVASRSVISWMWWEVGRP